MPGDQSTVTVGVNSAADAGTDAMTTVCDQGAAIDLFLELGGTPDGGGSWTDPNGNAHTNTFDPSSDPAGIYTYTLAGQAPCPGDQSTVTVGVNSAADAGTDAMTTVCDQGAAIDLFLELGGTPDGGGSWTDPNGNAHTNTFDPSSDIAGIYTYALAGQAPCPGASATISIALESAPDAGLDALVQICGGSASFTLLDSLGGSPQATGTWVDPNGTAFGGTFVPGVSVNGTYTYTVAGTACPSDQATLMVTQLPGPNAGQSNAIALCDDGLSIVMTDSLLGMPDANGTWTDPNGDPTGGLFDPSFMQGGTYTYTVPGNAVCPSVSSTLTIALSGSVTAGTAGAAEICSDAGVFDLFTALNGNPDPGGSWTDPNGDPIGGLFDPSTGTTGSYTYTVAAVVPCPAASATIIVEVTQAPDAGEDAVSSFCDQAAPVALLAQLGGTPTAGGQWTDPDGMATTGTFDPSTGTTGTYVYVAPGMAPCTNDTAMLTIAVVPGVDAGQDGSTSVCSDDPVFDLFPLLEGSPQPGGTWSGPDGSISGSVDPSSMTGGVYTYTIAGTPPCPDAQADVVVDVIPVPDAQIFMDATNGCAPVEVQFSTDHSGGGDILWTFGNGEISTDLLPPPVEYPDPGSYDVSLFIDPGNGCTGLFELADAVQVHEKPEAAFDALPEVPTTFAPEVYFHNTSIGATSYWWTFDDLGHSEDVHPLFTFPSEQPGTYEVCLEAIVAPTCSDTTCTLITIEAAMNVYVPNAFTPDGNGQNESFRPISVGLDPDQYEFLVFDRWGQVLFRTTDPEEAWDGNYAGGSPVPQGVYVWKLNAKDLYSPNRVERIGHVTLVR
ncbi:MAG: gliding motility-associated C-terminal domain-containing protein [Flavobacteriales bacterium]|nr:gliding motility-associated C-terminal domain-containing protein [Flavobacteriales bacterium]